MEPFHLKNERAEGYFDESGEGVQLAGGGGGREVRGKAKRYNETVEGLQQKLQGGLS